MVACACVMMAGAGERCQTTESFCICGIVVRRTYLVGESGLNGLPARWLSIASLHLHDVEIEKAGLSALCLLGNQFVV